MAPNAGGALASLGNMLTRTTKDSTPAFSGGIVGRMGAITKLERRAAKNARSKAVLRGDLNLARISRMNGKGLMKRCRISLLFVATTNCLMGDRKSVV